jgi:formylglycine-generating enzyme
MTQGCYVAIQVKCSDDSVLKTRERGSVINFAIIFRTTKNFLFLMVQSLKILLWRFFLPGLLGGILFTLPVSLEAKTRIGLMGFETGTGLDSSYGLLFYDTLLEQLLNSRRFTVLDQEEFNRAMANIARIQPDLSVLELRKRVIEQLAIENLYLGSLYKINGKFHLGLKVINRRGIIKKIVKHSCSGEQEIEESISVIVKELLKEPDFVKSGEPDDSSIKEEHGILTSWSGLPSFLSEIPDTAVNTRLNDNSKKARGKQKLAAIQLNLPLEVKTRKTGISFRLVPAGSFVMGSPSFEPGRDNDEGPIHQVKITQPLYFGVFEITQSQWLMVMKNNPSYFRDSSPRAPVESITWEDAREFCLLLDMFEGAPIGTFGLPSEAEWEYACRAGTNNALYTGSLTIKARNHGPELDAIAWYGGNSGVTYDNGYDSSKWKGKQYDHQKAGIHGVGLKMANGYGLHDMLGNVWEWCLDWYDKDYYRSSSINDPKGPEHGLHHVFRGGGWYSDARVCRSANRPMYFPRSGNAFLGVRIIMRLGREK